LSVLKILVIEPDPKARLAMVSMLNAAADIQVAGIASNAMQALMQVNMRKPDLLLLDVTQHSDAVDTFLNQMLETAPLPVVLLARQVLPGSDGQRKAIRAGVASLLVKPVEGVTVHDQDFCSKLIKQIRRTVQRFPAMDSKPDLAASATPARPRAIKPESVAASTGAIRHRPMLDKLIAIGASTGGTQALRQVVARFPVDSNAVVIVQHLPKAFAASFIDKLNKAAAMHVVSAEDGMEICKGHIYVGAGDEHFTIERNSTGFICRVSGNERVSGHCPSVNALFDSVAEHAGSKAVGALMTGMGDDGATGLKKMREARARTVAQDKDSSVVWGMPGVAVKIGAAEEQVCLNDLGERLILLSR